MTVFILPPRRAAAHRPGVRRLIDEARRRARGRRIRALAVALAVVALVTTPPWSAVEAPQGGVYVVVSGSTLVAPGAKLLVIYADGSRERIKVIWVSKPIRAGFYYHVIPSAHRTHARRPIALELKRGTRIVARQVLQTPPRGH